MPHSVTWIDRLRIERFVWALDQQLYDLPRSSRIATRRDVRGNVLAAAADVGTTAALRRLGDSRQLAEGYLTSELGEGPRHSWIAAAYFATLVPLLTTFVFAEAASAYAHGVVAANHNVTGHFTWGGISYLQTTVEYTFTDGRLSQVGGAWTPLTYAVWIIGTVLVGRLWRLLPWARRR
jgi:hypothetical protein